VLREGRVEWLLCGTAAVYRAIRSLHLGEADVVLLPDYNCGIEVSAVLAAGARVAFYRVGRDGAIDLADLLGKVQGPVKVVYVIHYFGFSHDVGPILDAAKARGAYVIEDCAHNLYGTAEARCAGTSGDIAIFSPRKTLPLMDGGALRYNGDLEACRDPLLPPDRAHTFRELLWSLSQHSRRLPGRMPRAGSRLLRALARSVEWSFRIDAPLSTVGSEDFDRVEGRLDRRMSGLSRRILETVDHDEVVRRRRFNYEYLLEHLPRSESVGFLYPTLPEGACPLYMPLLSAARDDMHRHLLSRGIESFRYWEWTHPALPAHGCGDAAFLRAHLLCLPVHQDLDGGDLSACVDAVDDYASGRSRSSLAT
jgi:dTDP-4-amino-4,6-dideoxygalactose transaminase